MSDRTLRFRIGWESYTSWYLVPTIRVGRWWAFVTWLKLDFGVSYW